MIITINICIICLTILISISAILYIANKNLKRKYNQKEFELELEKYKFFGSVDTKKIGEELDDMVKDYFGYYVLYHFQAQGKKYIKEDEMRQGVKEITKSIIMDMSELYTFYFKMLYQIDTEEALTAKVYEMVNNDMIAFAADYNAPKETDNGVEL